MHVIEASSVVLEHSEHKTVVDMKIFINSSK